ncbi:hypothetical protein [Curtobacterium sp. VKM Ac-1393]|uniref:hypothetical protein n=1 Tax=Curtobacterium sp. VKM Ac-1393 TaxID=2783814 RepID=UPI00188CB475|nr:hypothetical protein [Curtobacterium sp. VKM Ac-1393]MBF4609586.1 hypothetical protein [Curtobacterium sp. VKM Ac-1393]
MVATISAGGASVQISVIADTEDAGLLRIQQELPEGWHVRAHTSTRTAGVSTPPTGSEDAIRLIV